MGDVTKGDNLLAEPAGVVDPLRDPTSMLRQVFVERVARNPSYSLRAFARNLGVSHAYLSMILHGKRRIPARLALLISQVAGFDDKEAEAFLAACREATLRHGASRAGEKKLERQSDYFRIELDRFRVLSDWYHLAILDLTQLFGFQPDAAWIAKRLGIKVADVRAAVERLSRLGLIRIEPGGWQKTHAKLEVPTSRPDEAIRRFHFQMIEKAREAAASDRQEDYDARDITGITMPLNPARLAEAKKRIKRFRRSLLGYVSQGKCTELYQLNVQLFPLTRKVKAGGNA